MAEYTLVKATKEHFATIKNWFNNDTELAQWAGPDVKLNLPLNDFVDQLKIDELNSFCLTNNEEICGVGQFYVRLGKHHFGRLGIAPDKRGLGLAYILLQQLAAKTSQLQSASQYSLFVVEHNKPALKAYQKVGFEFIQYPEDIPGNIPDCRYMVAKKLRF